MRRKTCDQDVLSERLRARLKELGMSQAQLSRKSGLSVSYISQLSNGHRGRRTSATTVHRLARALKVRPDYFLSDAGAQTRPASDRPA